jgi:hypothetical protein
VPHAPDRRQQENDYQTFAAQRMKDIQERVAREQISPYEAGMRLLAERGDFHDYYRTLLNDARA